MQHDLVQQFLTQKFLAEAGLSPDARDLAQALDTLANFSTLVLDENKHTNLTRITSEPDFTIKNIIDSLTVLPHIKNATAAVDVGTGAGFPGMVVAIVRPDLKMTLIDTSRKRVRFLCRAVESLGMENVEVLHIDAKGFARTGARFPTCLARAVAPMPRLIDLCAPLLCDGGLLVAQKGPGAEAELDCAAAVMKKRRMRLLGIHDVLIHADVVRRVLLFVREVTRNMENIL